eukprot:5130412-Prymnesium_polylepis.1
MRGINTVRQCGGGAAVPGPGISNKWSPSRCTLPAPAPGSLNSTPPVKRAQSSPSNDRTAPIHGAPACRNDNASEANAGMRRSSRPVARSSRCASLAVARTSSHTERVCATSAAVRALAEMVKPSVRNSAAHALRSRLTGMGSTASTSMLATEDASSDDSSSDDSSLSFSCSPSSTPCCCSACPFSWSRSASSTPVSFASTMQCPFKSSSSMSPSFSFPVAAITTVHIRTLRLCGVPANTCAVGRTAATTPRDQVPPKKSCTSAPTETGMYSTASGTRANMLATSTLGRL